MLVIHTVYLISVVDINPVDLVEATYISGLYVPYRTLTFTPTLNYWVIQQLYNSRG
jgi:hypothetical protein